LQSLLSHCHALTLHCIAAPLSLLQVADHVGTKNKTQCETHYADVYCSNPQLLPVRRT
jgi:hypothetical protein